MTHTCLIIDDSAVLRTLTRHILERLDFTCQEAADGTDAQALCRNDMPALILLDWHMPEMDGLAFAEWLRSAPGGDKPYVIFCSVRNKKADIAQALSAGADEYIMKPFDEAVILAKLSHLSLLHGGRDEADNI